MNMTNNEEYRSIALVTSIAICIANCTNAYSQEGSQSEDLITLHCEYKAHTWGSRTNFKEHNFDSYFDYTVDLEGKKAFRWGPAPFFYNFLRTEFNSWEKPDADDPQSVSENYITISRFDRTPSRLGISESISRISGDYEYEATYPDGSGGVSADGSCEEAALKRFPKRKF